MEAGSKGKGSACVKPGSFFTPCQAPGVRMPKAGQRYCFQQVPEAGFLLSASMRPSRSRLIIMASTYHRAPNKRTHHGFSHSWSLCTLKAYCKSYSRMSTWHQSIEGIKYFLLSAPAAGPGLILNAFLQGYGYGPLLHPLRTTAAHSQASQSCMSHIYRHISQEKKSIFWVDPCGLSLARQFCSLFAFPRASPSVCGMHSHSHALLLSYHTYTK